MRESSQRFTGKQITTIVIAVAAAVVLMPAAVYAAATAVNIADPSTGNKARVVNGKLSVGDGAGPVSVDGTVRVYDGSGPLTVDGAVSVKQPSGNFSKYAFATDTGDAVLYDIPANAGVAISSLTAAHEVGTGPAMVRVRTLTPNTPNNCTSGGTVVDEITAITVPADDTRSASYSPPILVPKSSSEKCLIAFVFLASGTQRVAVTATGFRY